MTPVFEEAVFARDPDVVGVEVGGDIVVLDSRHWNYLDFDDIGSHIWLLLKEPRTLSALVGELALEFSVDEAVCRRDTEFFLRDLIKMGVVTARKADEG